MATRGGTPAATTCCSHTPQQYSYTGRSIPPRPKEVQSASAHWSHGPSPHRQQQRTSRQHRTGSMLRSDGSSTQCLWGITQVCAAFAVGVPGARCCCASHSAVCCRHAKSVLGTVLHHLAQAPITTNPARLLPLRLPALYAVACTVTQPHCASARVLCCQNSHPHRSSSWLGPWTS